MRKERGREVQDLPDAILTNVFGLVSDVRTRNAMSLACRRWRDIERTTRRCITLRGNIRNLFLLPTCFSDITHLDLSLLSPWGYSLLHHHHHHHDADDGDGEVDDDHGVVVARRLGLAFPRVTLLTVYARTTSIHRALVAQWPGLQHVKLVRWHQRPPHPPGSDLLPFLHGCSSLSSLDLSSFYYWPEDVPAALQTPVAPQSLTRLDLLCASCVEGFKSRELLVISSACPDLRHLLAPCVFDPQYHDFVGDDALASLASNCKNLSRLHLIDHSALSAPWANPGEEQGLAESEDARITPTGLEDLFLRLPLLEDLVLDVCHSVNYAGPALEALNRTCPRLESLKLGQFQGICSAAALHLDGVAVCGGLKSLSIKNSFDLTDSGLVAIARGCSRLCKFEMQGCKMVTEAGLRKFASMLRETLVDVGISCCRHLDAARSLQALEPVRDRIQRLHIDCIWSPHVQEPLLGSAKREGNTIGADLDEFDEEYSGDMSENDDDDLNSKKCRLSGEEYSGYGCNDLLQADEVEFWCRTWKRLKYLSLWVPVGELLIPLAELGLESCPVLEEIYVKVEGSLRLRPALEKQAFGLSTLAYYPQLSKMKLDCGDVIGFLHTAPNGRVDLSECQRFYLNGIEKLQLAHLDYWPPQDRDMNQRSLCLPAIGLLAQCATLRKLFIHGTTHEHFMGMLLNMPNLRDVQLREDYYPAPENDTTTEMRVDSCRRFESALNRRVIPD